MWVCSCLWHSPCFITFFWWVSCRCPFIGYPGTAGTNTLGPGLPSLRLVLLEAGSGPTSAWSGESLGEEDAEGHDLPPPLHPPLQRCRVYRCCITCKLGISSLYWQVTAMDSSHYINPGGTFIFCPLHEIKERSLHVLSPLGKAPGQKQSGLFLPHCNSPSNPIHTSRV